MAELGKRNSLPILHSSPHGLFLDGGERGEILLPRRYEPSDPSLSKPGALLDVFVYRDSEDRLVATTEKPFAMAGEFACLKVIGHKNGVGAFLDWGLQKDLLMPLREQVGDIRMDDSVVVAIFVDDKSDRIAASMRLNRHMNFNPPAYKQDHPVQCLISGGTPLGCTAIVENGWHGMFYHTDLAAPLEYGQRVQAFVRTVRSDGKLDLSLDRAGFSRIKPLREQILQHLESHSGTFPLNDNSTPEDIRATFGVSKKAFKQALGALYKKRLIQMDGDGTHLIRK